MVAEMTADIVDPASSRRSLLDVTELTAFYGSFQALFGVTLSVGPGEAIALIGAPGAGKSTFLKAIAGLVHAPRRAIRFDGRDLSGLSPAEINHAGIALVPEGRRLFDSLTVEENLTIGQPGGRGLRTLDRVYALFPALTACRRVSARRVPGGQKQMAAIGRALMSNPRLLLCDQVSRGLAPTAISELHVALESIRSDGVSLVFVEQDAGRAMATADRFYCFRRGLVTLFGNPADATWEAIRAAYFGL